MSQSLVKNLLHLIFSTKHRRAWIPKSVRDELFAYQAGICQQWNSPALTIGGVGDHVHILFSSSKNHALKRVVEEIKKGSSKWMKSHGVKDSGFCWQRGYAAFSVSESNTAEVKHYIEHQKEHHDKVSFQDELHELFACHGVYYDERYVWD